MDGRRAERQVRPVVAGRPGALDEQRDAQRILARPLARADAGRSTPDATSTPTAGTARTASRDVGGIEAAGQDDRHLAGDRRGQPLGDARAGAAGMWPAGGVEEEPLDTAGEVGTAARRRCSAAAAAAVAPARRPAGGGPSRSGGRAAARRSSDSAPLSWTTSGSIARDDRGQLVGAAVGGHGDDPRPAPAGASRPDQRGPGPRPRRGRARAASPGRG